MELDAIRFDAGADPVGAVIWLHGLGADGHDFEGVVPMLDLAQPLRFVFPHAPRRAVTINGGAEMRAWYDIDAHNPLAGGDDIAASAAAVGELARAEEAAGMARGRIALAGFSQGGVVALHLGLGSPQRFAGIAALSTYVHDHEHVAERVRAQSLDTPILMAHGRTDPLIPMDLASASRDALARLGCRVEWREYDMGHQVCAQEIGDIGRWLNGLYR